MTEMGSYPGALGSLEADVGKSQPCSPAHYSELPFQHLPEHFWCNGKQRPGLRIYPAHSESSTGQTALISGRS